MKRSEINRYLDEAADFFARHRFHLPPFAFWTPQQWRTVGPEADEIRTCRLGWDLTDFCAGRFEQVGLTLFTLRNGRPGSVEHPKVYAEKIMMVREGQVTPFHFHWKKTEDIINRGAGVLVVELYNCDAAEQFTDAPVRVSCDGLVSEVPAGGKVELGPGESITLPPRLYHSFHAKKGMGHALIGEVSSVNDDATDNRFHAPLPRYPSIEEDAPPRRLLCTEYPAARRR